MTKLNLFPKKVQKFYWIVFILLVFFCLWINFTGASWVQRLYEQKDFGSLNKFSASSVDRTLEFYQGKIDDVWIGPVTNVVVHVLFLIFCLIYLQGASAKSFCFWTFLFLAVSKFNILFYPPYGDAIGGPFAEGLWLAKNNFNYAALFDQPGYNFGGPKAYFFSLYPTYLAVLYKLISSVPVFLLVNHFLVFLMCAVIVSLSRQIILKAGYDRTLAVFSAICVLALPLFQSQTEAINMEMPCLLFSVLAVYDLINKKIGRACLFAIIAAFVKGHGILICGTVFLVSVWLFLSDKDLKYKGRTILWGMTAIVFGTLLVLSKFLLKDQHAGMMKLFAGLPSLKIMYLPWFYFAAVVLFFGFVFWSNHGGKKILSVLMNQYYTQCVVFIAAGMWYVLFLNFYAVSPRYKLELAPFLLLALLFGVFSWVKIRKVLLAVMFLTVGVSSFASFGFFEKPVIPNYHIFSERSLEYRNDLKLNVELAKFLEKDFKDYTIGAPFLMAQMLAIPEFGYVAKPMDVVVYGMPIHYANIKNFEGLQKMNIMRTVWVAFACHFENKNGTYYPIHPQDKVIREMELGENKLTLFMGGFAIEQRRQLIEMIEKYKK